MNGNTLADELRLIAVESFGKAATKKARRTARMCDAQRHRRNMELLKKLREKIEKNS